MEAIVLAANSLGDSGPAGNLPRRAAFYAPAQRFSDCRPSFRAKARSPVPVFPLVLSPSFVSQGLRFPAAMPVSGDLVGFLRGSLSENYGRY